MFNLKNNQPNIITVNWELTTTCNYKCWYCSEEEHYSGKYRWPDLEKSLIFFRRLSLKNNPIYLNLCGGEPTLWPDLIKFVTELPPNFNLDVLTNGSRSIRWWKESSKYLKSVCISFHPDTTDPDHILEVLKVLVDSPITYINVLLIASKSSIDKCYYLHEKIVELKLPINAYPKALYKMHGASTQEIIDDNNNDPKVVKFLSKKYKIIQSNHDISNIKPIHIFLNNEKLNIPQAVINKENSFTGWNCLIGVRRLNILANGDIYRGACRSGGKIGSIFDENFVFPTNPHICDLKFCTCLDDIRVEKWKD